MTRQLELTEYLSTANNTVVTDGGTDWTDTCLSFTVSGEWGHFRRIEGNLVKQTYRIMPRTTVAGLIAAILGIERDGYYDIFGPENSRIAIEPTSELRTMNVPENTLGTANKNMLSESDGGLTMTTEDGSGNRKQHNYEMLVDPSYRIDVALKNRDVYQKLRDYLETGKTHYTPSLGLSECLASIEYHGEHDVETEQSDDPVEIVSAVPDREPMITPGITFSTERSPAYMTAHQGSDGFSKRKTTGFTSYTYREDGGEVRVPSGKSSLVDSRRVIFK